MTSPKEIPSRALHLEWAKKGIDALKASDQAAAEERRRLADWESQFGPAVVRVLKTYGNPTTNLIDGRQQWKTPSIPAKLDRNQTLPVWLEGVKDRTGDFTDVAIKIGGDILFQYVRGEVSTGRGIPPPDSFERRLGTNLLQALETALAERPSAPSSTT